MALAMAGVALVGAVVVPAVTHGPGLAASPAGLGQAAALRPPGATASLGAHASQHGSGAFAPSSARASSKPMRTPAVRRTAQRPAQPQSQQPQSQQQQQQHHTQQAAVASVYQNPLRGISGLIPERIDMGVDFGGTGPVYALGNAVITDACGVCYGWPGGGWITYRLTGGPAAGLMVFVAEDVRPTVTVGQKVSSPTVIASMFDGGAGIETGWAMASALSAESQLPEAGGISGGGPFPTIIGMNFEELLQTLGVPAGNNRDQAPYGILPPDYPADWASALYPRP